MAQFDDLFNFYEKEFGKDIVVNDEDYTRIAYIKDVAIKTSFFNDKVIFTKYELKTGDVITLENEKWIVITQADKYKTYNVATIRQADFVTRFVFYGSVYEAPCIYMNQSLTSKNNQVSLTDSKTVCVLPHYGWVDNIKIGDRFVQFGYFWKVTGFDFTKEGLVYVHAERDVEADYESIQNGYDSSELLYDWIIKWEILPATVIAGHSYPIKATLIKIFKDGHTEAAPEGFYYETSDKETAIIVENELVARKSGKVTIKAMFSKDLTKVIEREIEIYPTGDKLSLQFTPFPNVMFTEDKNTITANLYKNGVIQSEAVISYFIPDTYADIAEIDEKHKVTALKPGRFFVYATYKDQYNDLTISKSVDVRQSKYSIAFESQSKLFQVKSKRSCKAFVYRNNVIDMAKPVSYESSNVEVASISGDGVLSAETLGSAVITAYLLGNRDVKISKPIEVVEDAYEVIWDKYVSGRLYLDKTYQCHAIITKNYEPVPTSENLEVGYLSSDDRIVKVDDNGNITVLKEGKATITAYIKTKPTIKNISDVYIDRAFFEMHIVSRGASTENDFNEKHIYWGKDHRTSIDEELLKKFDVGIWGGYNIVVTRDGEIVTTDFLAKDCVKIYVDDRDYTSAYFNEADLLHARAYHQRVPHGDYEYINYNYKTDRKRQTMPLNEFHFYGVSGYFHTYKIVVNIPSHPEIPEKSLEWSFIPYSESILSKPEYTEQLNYIDKNGERKVTELKYPEQRDSSGYIQVGSKQSVINNTVDRVEIEQVQLSSDNITFMSLDPVELILQRDKEESWRYGEYGKDALNKPDMERYETKLYDGKYVFMHDRNGMLTGTRYYRAKYHIKSYQLWTPEYTLDGNYEVDEPKYIKDWLAKYKDFMPFNKVSTNDDTVVSAEFTKTNWNYLRGIGIGSAVATTEYGYLNQKSLVQAVSRFQTTVSCVRTTGLGLYLTSNKIIPCNRMMGIGAYATLNSKLLPSEDMVFEIYDNGGNDVVLYNVPKIHDGGLIENGEPREIPFRDGWREDPVYAARNPYEIKKAKNSSQYVDIDANGDIVWDYSMRFVYVKNKVPMGSIYIKAYNKDYPNNYVIRRLYVSEYLSPINRLKMWLGFKKTLSSDLPRYGIAELPINWSYITDYKSTGSVEFSVQHQRLICSTLRDWIRDVKSYPRYNYPYDYRYMSIFLYDQSQPNNLIKPEDKYDIGFWRWGFDYNDYGGYSTYNGDGVGAKIYNNQIIIDLRSWFQYINIWKPFYLIFQNWGLGMDSFTSSLATYNYMDDSMFDYSAPTGNYVLGQATRKEVLKLGFDGTIDEAMKNLAINRAYQEYERKYSTTGNDAYQWSSIGYTKLWFENLPEPVYKYIMIINNAPTPFNLHQWYLSLYADWFNQMNGDDYNYTYGAGNVGYPETYDYTKKFNSPLEIIASRKFQIDPNNLFDHAYLKYMHGWFAIKHVNSLELVGIGNEYIGGYIYGWDGSVITPW